MPTITNHTASDGNAAAQKQLREHYDILTKQVAGLEKTYRDLGLKFFVLPPFLRTDLFGPYLHHGERVFLHSVGEGNAAQLLLQLRTALTEVKTHIISSRFQHIAERELALAEEKLGEANEIFARADAIISPLVDRIRFWYPGHYGEVEAPLRVVQRLPGVRLPTTELDGRYAAFRAFALTVREVHNRIDLGDTEKGAIASLRADATETEDAMVKDVGEETTDGEHDADGEVTDDDYFSNSEDERDNDDSDDDDSDEDFPGIAATANVLLRAVRNYRVRWGHSSARLRYAGVASPRSMFAHRRDVAVRAHLQPILAGTRDNGAAHLQAAHQGPAVGGELLDIESLTDSDDHAGEQVPDIEALTDSEDCASISPGLWPMGGFPFWTSLSLTLSGDEGDAEDDEGDEEDDDSHDDDSSTVTNPWEDPDENMARRLGYDSDEDGSLIRYEDILRRHGITGTPPRQRAIGLVIAVRRPGRVVRAGRRSV